MKLSQNIRRALLVIPIIMGITTNTWGESSETRWYFSDAGSSHWHYLQDADVSVDKIKLGDFNGDGTTDVFTTRDGKWYVSYGGNSKWEYLISSNVTVDNIRLGDFNGDGKTDVFTTLGGKWYVSYGGNSKWKYLVTSRTPLDSMRFGDVNGDGKTDIFTSMRTPKAIIPKSKDGKTPVF